MSGGNIRACERDGLWKGEITEEFDMSLWSHCLLSFQLFRHDKIKSATFIVVEVAS